MSVVTTIILTTGELYQSGSEPAYITLFNGWLTENSPYRQEMAEMLHLFEEIDYDKTGGGKNPQIEVWVSAHNHLGGNIADLVELVVNYPWNFPEDVVLIINPEEAMTTVHRPKPPSWVGSEWPTEPKH